MTRGEMTKDDVTKVIRALDSAKVTCWLAGGWGVDALLGRQTRRHDDVDLVIADFNDQIGVACATLEATGFHIAAKEQTALMPCIYGLEDDMHHRVDLISLDWTRLGSALGADAATADSFEPALSIGTIGGCKVDCLSLPAQRLLHSGFTLRLVDREDIGLLEGPCIGSGRPLGSARHRHRW
jgi:lincosamide nucleotidyltransferase A/C/D/E